jgi:hypothetical protein
MNLLKIISLLLLLVACTSKHQNTKKRFSEKSVYHNQLIEGKWLNTIDSNSIWIVSKDRILMIQDEHIDTFDYRIDYGQCNTDYFCNYLYLTHKKLKDENYCYEIDYIDSLYMTFFFIGRGNMLSFKKVKYF